MSAPSRLTTRSDSPASDTSSDSEEGSYPRLRPISPTSVGTDEEFEEEHKPTKLAPTKDPVTLLREQTARDPALFMKPIPQRILQKFNATHKITPAASVKKFVLKKPVRPPLTPYTEEDDYSTLMPLEEFKF